MISPTAETPMLPPVIKIVVGAPGVIGFPLMLLIFRISESASVSFAIIFIMMGELGIEYLSGLAIGRLFWIFGLV